MPVGELRAAIPIGIGFYNLSISEVAIISIIADMLVVVFLLYSLSPITKFLAGRSKKIDKAFNWLFEHTRRNFFHNHRVWGDIALMLLVAIPLPLTGVWTAGIAAWLLEIPKIQALVYMTIGLILSSAIVGFLSISAIKIF